MILPPASFLTLLANLPLAPLFEPTLLPAGAPASPVPDSTFSKLVTEISADPAPQPVATTSAQPVAPAAIRRAIASTPLHLRQQPASESSALPAMIAVPLPAIPLPSPVPSKPDTEPTAATSASPAPAPQLTDRAPITLQPPPILEVKLHFNDAPPPITAPLPIPPTQTGEPSPALLPADVRHPGSIPVSIDPIPSQAPRRTALATRTAPTIQSVPLQRAAGVERAVPAISRPVHAQSKPSAPKPGLTEASADPESESTSDDEAHPAAEPARTPRTSQPETHNTPAAAPPATIPAEHLLNHVTAPPLAPAATTAPTAPSSAVPAEMAATIPTPAAPQLPAPPKPELIEPSTAPMRAEQIAEQKAAAPLRTFNLEFTPDGMHDVKVRLTERAGDVHISLHGTDQAVAGRLRESVVELIGSLNKAGYEAEAWTPSRERQQQQHEESHTPRRQYASAHGGQHFEGILNQPLQENS